MNWLKEWYLVKILWLFSIIKMDDLIFAFICFYYNGNLPSTTSHFQKWFFHQYFYKHFEFAIFLIT